MKRLRVLLPVVLIILALSACDEFFPSENAIASVALTPTSLFMKTGEQQQFTATQTTIGGTSSDVTTSATWATSNSGVANVSTGGLVTAATTISGLGSATISAQSGGQTGSSTVTVAAGKLTGITLGPTNTTITRGNTLQLVATGNFDSGASSQTITNLVSWSTSDSTIATISAGGLVSTPSTSNGGQVTFTAKANTTGSNTVGGTLTVTVQ